MQRIDDGHFGRIFGRFYRIREVDGFIGHLQDQLAEANEKAAELWQRANQAEGEIKFSKSKLDEMESAVAQSSRELELCQQKIMEYNEQLLASSEQAGQWSKKLAEYERLLGDKDTELAKKARENEMLADQVRSMRDQLEQQQSLSARYAKQEEEISSRFAQQQESLRTQLIKQQEAMQAEIVKQQQSAQAQLIRQRDAMQAGFAQQQEALCAQHNQQMKTLSDQSAQQGQMLRQNLEQAQQELASYRRDMAAKDQILAEQEGRLRALTERVGSYHSADEGLRKQMDECLRRCAQQEQHITELNRQLAEQDEQLNYSTTQITGMQQQLSSKDEELAHCRAEVQRLSVFETLAGENDELNAMLGTQTSEITDLNEQLAQLQSVYEQTTSRAKWLSSRVAQQDKEISEYEKLMSDDKVEQANDKAKKILADAIEESNRLYQEVQNVRERVLSATRAAYYNAMQFRMALVERFSVMERDIDNAIDILRVLEIPQIPDRALVGDGRDYGEEKQQEQEDIPEKPYAPQEIHKFYMDDEDE